MRDWEVGVLTIIWTERARGTVTCYNMPDEHKKLANIGGRRLIKMTFNFLFAGLLHIEISIEL